MTEKKQPETNASADVEGSKIKAGDIVMAEFDAWIVDTNELFDTTNEALAKENNIHNEKMVYGAQPLIVGKERLFPGLDEHMLKAEVGKEYEVVIPSEKAAGPRDPKLVELHPVREFLKQDIEPRVGLEVTVKNRPAYITAVTAGRVRVDFNNRLAGKSLKYKYKITQKPTDPKEIVALLLKMAYGSSEGFDVEHHGKSYKIKLPDSCKYDQKWFIAKYRVVSDLRDVADAETVTFLEEYVKPEKKEPVLEAKAEPEKKESVQAAKAKPEKKEPAPEAKKAEPETKKKPEPAAESRAPEELSEEDRKV